eukprot:4279714-Lingulodinium_polyedra.AAC.1
MTREPANPTGKATRTADALTRWAEGHWSYSPYRYSEDLLDWEAEAWRCPNSNERAQMLGGSKW